MTFLGVAVGGGLGALARDLVQGVIARRQTNPFPLSTLSVNVSGSMVFGVVTGLAVSGRISHTVLTAGGAGFLGAFTTFSTFTYETGRLMEDGAWLYALANVAISAILTLGGAAIGYLAVV